MVQKIKDLSNSKGLSIAALEVKAGLGNGTIGKWDKSSPTLSVLEKVSVALDMTLMDLLEIIHAGKENQNETEI